VQGAAAAVIAGSIVLDTHGNNGRSGSGSSSSGGSNGVGGGGGGGGDKKAFAVVKLECAEYKDRAHALQVCLINMILHASKNHGQNMTRKPHARFSVNTHK
jgi:hypothetical protein